MGSGRFDSTSYRAFSASTVGKSTEEVYTSAKLNTLLDPNGVKMRESRDSADNPNSTPLIVALDVTGSMGILADNIARDGLGVLYNSILDRKPIQDPHVMFMAIGDANFDRAPLQVSQFEADNRIVEQLTQIFLEKGGGGNNFESYNLAWYFAALHTEHDSFAKRGKRGYLFTVGDECAPGDLTMDQIKRILGDDLQSPLTSAQMLEMAQRSYEVFHVVILEGDYAKGRPTKVLESWRTLLGQRVIPLSDHKQLAKTIVSAIEIAEGVDVDESAGRWGEVAAIVRDAVREIPKSPAPGLA